MRLSEELLKKVKATKNGAAKIAIEIGKSTRQVERYIKENSFPDDYDSKILSTIEKFSAKKGKSGCK